MPCPHYCFCDSVSDTAVSLLLASCNYSPPYREGLGVGPLGLFGLFSLLRNNLRRFLLHYPADVERDYEEDHDGGYTYTSEDG